MFRTMWSQDRDVVLAGRIIDLGEPWGDGNLGEGGVSLQATWDHAWQDSTTQKEGFQVSERELARGN